MDTSKVDIAIGDKGYIHVIKAMMTPAMKDISTFATDSETPAFSKLVAALGKADLVDTLKGLCVNSRTNCLNCVGQHDRCNILSHNFSGTQRLS